MSNTAAEAKKKRKRADAARRRINKLPRDAKGKLLPKGSKNLFKRKKAKRVLGRKKPNPKVRPKRRKSSNSPVQGMARRRKRRTSSKDEHPNFMTGTLVTPFPEELSTLVTQKFDTPINRIQSINSKMATVMEVLWIEWYVQSPISIFTATGSTVVWQFQLGQRPNTFLPGFDDPRVFAGSIEALLRTDAPQSSGMFINRYPQVFDLQDKEGNGYILASDSFNVSVVLTPKIDGNFSFAWRLFYRFIEIPTLEFVGVLQSLTQT